MAVDAEVDQPADVPDMVYRAEAYEADVARLRALGCQCMLHCEVDGPRVRAVPLNQMIADACKVDHRWR